MINFIRMLIWVSGLQQIDVYQSNGAFDFTINIVRTQLFLEIISPRFETAFHETASRVSEF